MKRTLFAAMITRRTVDGEFSTTPAAMFDTEADAINYINDLNTIEYRAQQEPHPYADIEPTWVHGFVMPVEYYTGNLGPVEWNTEHSMFMPTEAR